ncbi:UNVERIFIED_ORG: trypsin-like peptidase [Martelella mediterranea]
MTDEMFFLKSIRFFGEVELYFKNTPVLDCFDRGLGFLEEQLPDFADLFASPSARREENGRLVSVAWYSRFSGNIQSWQECDPATRARVVETIQQLATELRRAADTTNAEDAALVQLWLNICALESDLLVVDGKPVIINWGIVPEPVGHDPARIDAHFRTNLGRFLPETPQNDAEDTAPPSAAAVSNAGLSGSLAAQTAATSGSTEAESNRLAHEQNSIRYGFWCSPWPVAIACIVAAVILIILLIPGVLLYRTSTGSAAVLTPQVLAASEQELLERARTLRNELDSNACLPNESIGALPANPSAPSTHALSDPLSSDQSALGRLQDATVLVIALEEDGNFSSGSGFFVSDDLVITNRHVIENAQTDGLFITNKRLGTVLPVALAAESQTRSFGEADFAALRTAAETDIPWLSVTDQSGQGEEVLAAGFPAAFMETDAAFTDLLNGDAAATPNMVLTEGIVTVVQESPAGMQLFLHSADISAGSSGGPLTDRCGRVIAVNTFIKTSSEQQVRLNFALGSDSLIAFAATHGLDGLTEENSACDAVQPGRLP